MTTDDERRILVDRTQPSDSDSPPSLVGETREILPGILFQSPSLEVIGSLMTADSRIRYVPADLTQVNSGDEAQEVFNTTVIPQLNAKIQQEFPTYNGKDLFTRGVVVSIRDEFPCFPTKEYIPGVGIIYNPVDNALTLLRKGHEGLRPSWRHGDFKDGRISFMPQKYMYDYTKKAVNGLFDRGEMQQADNLFPALFLYTFPTIHNWHAIQPASRISAFYITDRILPKRA